MDRQGGGAAEFQAYATIPIADRADQLTSEPSPFHKDELQAQALAGLSAKGTGIRTVLTDQLRQFFPLLRYAFIGCVDADGWPIAAVLWGDACFIQSPTDTSLLIGAIPPLDDPASACLVTNAPIGILGLDLRTRRRNRANGVIAQVNAGGLEVAVQQSFGNCAQYIQVREDKPTRRVAGSVNHFRSLDSAVEKIIKEADTLFVATASGPGIAERGGLDISHRGGYPGFVHVDGDTLFIPDFKGNSYFNTLGNLIGEPRCSLLFINFPTGGIVQLQGRAEINWATTSQLSGAARQWAFHLEQGWYREGALPIEWSEPEFAPALF
ncbi:MAG: pyridoxamine 5'-phosphate oxidase family protein [Beijerinckiaceae bacterium]